MLFTVKEKTFLEKLNDEIDQVAKNKNVDVQDGNLNKRKDDFKEAYDRMFGYNKDNISKIGDENDIETPKKDLSDFIQQRNKKERKWDDIEKEIVSQVEKLFEETERRCDSLDQLDGGNKGEDMKKNIVGRRKNWKSMLNVEKEKRKEWAWERKIDTLEVK